MLLLLAALLAQDKPGVVFVFSDEPPPARLAAEGVVLSRFYAAAPCGSPARVGLMTGASPARHRIHFELQKPGLNKAYGQDDALDPAAPFLARAFKDAGYATAHVGPWRMGGKPSAYGVDEEPADALDFLRRRKDAPFFLSLGQAAELGRILDVLDAKTYVIVAGEHGPAGTRSDGLRGQKHSLYDGGLRVPFVIRGPGLPPGVRDDAVGAVDLFPTLAALCGLKVPDGLDGEDRSGVLRGTSTPRAKPLFWNYGRGPNYPQPKLVYDRSPELAVLEGSWKLFCDLRGNSVELYDLAADRGEEKDVAGQHPERAEKLKAAALAWRMSLP